MLGDASSRGHTPIRVVFLDLLVLDLNNEHKTIVGTRLKEHRGTRKSVTFRKTNVLIINHKIMLFYMTNLEADSRDQGVNWTIRVRLIIWDTFSRYSW